MNSLNSLFWIIAQSIGILLFGYAIIVGLLIL